jgi:hypothetical protein
MKPAAPPNPHLWKVRGMWYCALVRRDRAGRVWRFDGMPVPISSEPLGMGMTPGEAGTVWRLVKHGRRYAEVTQ